MAVRQHALCGTATRQTCTPPKRADISNHEPRHAEQGVAQWVEERADLQLVGGKTLDSCRRDTCSFSPTPLSGLTASFWASGVILSKMLVLGRENLVGLMGAAVPSAFPLGRRAGLRDTGAALSTSSL